MRITEGQLRRIIREEVQALHEARPVFLSSRPGEFHADAGPLMAQVRELVQAGELDLAVDTLAQQVIEDMSDPTIAGTRDAHDAVRRIEDVASDNDYQITTAEVIRAVGMRDRASAQQLQRAFHSSQF